MQMVVTRTLCDACLTLPVAVAATPPHPELHLCSEYIPIKGENFEAKFKCRACDTIWLHRKNKWGACEGFRLNP